MHPIQVALKDFSLHIGYPLQAIGTFYCRAILHHDLTVLIIPVHQGKGGRRQVVEKCLFNIYIFPECFMIIQVFMGDICEYAASKAYTCRSFLVNGMGADFHKTIITTCHGHGRQHLVDLQGIRRGMGSRQGLVPHHVPDS